MIHNLSEVVRQFKQDWTSELDDEAITEVCREEGMRWRQTILTPIVTIKVFCLQILHGNTACEALRHLARMAFTGAAYCEARMRIPLSVFQRLLERTAARMQDAISDRGAGGGTVCSTWTVQVSPCPTNPFCKRNSASHLIRRLAAVFRWRTSWR